MKPVRAHSKSGDPVTYLSSSIIRFQGNRSFVMDLVSNVRRHLFFPMTRKRKPSGPPPLYDHNQTSTANRSYRRTGNGRHIIISSTQVPVDTHRDEIPYAPHPNLSDNMWPEFSTDHENLYIPSNPDNAENVGIKVVSAKRYETSVSVIYFSLLIFSQVSLRMRR